MEISVMTYGHPLWDAVISLAEDCQWKAGPVLADMMRSNAFSAAERVIAASDNGAPVGFCTFSLRDEFPEGSGYGPFIGFVYVDEYRRGNRLSQIMIDAACEYAASIGYEAVCIASGETGLYEKYGFEYVCDADTVYGATDHLFRKKLIQPQIRTQKGNTMGTIFERIRKTGIVPVVVIENAEDAAALSDALCEGGLPAAEVTFRTAAAADAIRIMKERHPEMLVGAGTVLNAVQVDKAVAAGAEFIVSPGINPNTVRHCQQIEIPIIPGTQTPSDMEQAVELGLDTVKFFPAELSGGLAMIKACAEPFTMLSFMPSGGINASNAASYLEYPRITAVGGSWMVKKDLISSGDFEAIRKLTYEAAELVKRVRG